MNVTMTDLLLKALELKASDLHLTTSLPPMFRVNGTLFPMSDTLPLNPGDCERLIYELLDDTLKKRLEQSGELDFSFSLPKKAGSESIYINSARVLQLQSGLSLLTFPLLMIWVCRIV